MKNLHTLLAVATAALTRRPRPTSISASRCRPPASGPAGSLGIAEDHHRAAWPATRSKHRARRCQRPHGCGGQCAQPDQQEQVDAPRVTLGSTTTPNSLAMLDGVSENQTPMVSLPASRKVAGR